MILPFPPAKPCNPSPGKKFTASLWDPSHQEHQNLSVLCWTTSQPRGHCCCGCPRFGNLEVLPLPGASAVPVQSQQHQGALPGSRCQCWPPWGAAKWDNSWKKWFFPFPRQGTAAGSLAVPPRGCTQSPAHPPVPQGRLRGSSPLPAVQPCCYICWQHKNIAFQENPTRTGTEMWSQGVPASHRTGQCEDPAPTAQGQGAAPQCGRR